MDTRLVSPRPYYKAVALHVPSELEYLLPCRILRVGREQFTDRYPRFRGRLMDVHHLSYIEQGRGWLETGSFRGPLAPGSVHALYAGMRNNLWADPADPMELTWIVLEGEAVPQFGARAGLPAARPYAEIGPAAEPRGIFRELRSSDPGALWRAHALLWAFLARVAAANGIHDLGPPPVGARPHLPLDAPGRPIAPPEAVLPADAVATDDPAVARAMEMARMHAGEAQLHLDDLARAAGLGRARFTERFRRVTGVSPMRYVERLRMEEARQLLEAQAPVAYTARRVGFEDPLHFSRRFRAIHGVPPSRFRAIARGAPLT